jgi:response regulator RpfG family c-di-GMP phosphodiesterase
METARPKVLFVDDEQRLLEGLAALLRRDYDVRIATSGPDALRLLRETRDVAVVVSDFRMPQMDGATFLHEVIQVVPTATRILLTGEAGVDGARDAVNKGQIFRFLTKPCPPDELKLAIESGLQQHRLMNAERTVMQETLLECIAALTEVLAITNPVAFGRAQRIKRLAQGIAAALGTHGFWQLEAAALLSQIGYFAESPELAEKIYYSRPLTAAETARAAAVPANAQRLFEHVPRMEPVLQILAAMEWPDDALARAGERMVGVGARILSVALEYDTLTTRQVPAPQILATLRARSARYGANVLDALAASVGAQADEDEVTLPLKAAAPGMRLREEIRNSAGVLLVPIGFEVTPRLIDRLSQVAPEELDRAVRLRPAPKPAPA